MNAGSSWVFDTTSRTFRQDVLERSKQVPVVVDFWAAWCSPCRQLAPLLEKIVQELGGRVLLAKCNIDENPDIAAALQIQSIPFVVAFKDGQPVDQFVGVLPEETLRRWFDGLVPSVGEQLVEQAKQLEVSDPAAAERTYRQALENDPENAQAKIGLARVLLAQNRPDEAKRLIDELEKRGFLEPEAEQIRSRLQLQQAAEEAGDLAELRKEAEQNPDDDELQIKLAEALAAAGQYEEALQRCLALVQKDKTGAGVQAKETMLRIFSTLGEGSPLVSEYRRRLATALY